MPRTQTTVRIGLGYLRSVVAVFLVAMMTLHAPEAMADGLVPCGGPSESPCTLCHFLVGIHDIIEYFIGVMVILALAIITAMGVLYIVAGGNEGLIGTAKKGLWSTLSGIAIVLFAWLIVNTIIFWLLPTKSDLGVDASFSLTDGFQFNCNTTSLANDASLASGTVSTAGTASGGSSGGATSSESSCQALTSGPCSVSNLQSAFGSHAERMSRICNYESGGNAGNESGSDKCRNDPQRRAFSIGLFQINLTVHTLIDPSSGQSVNCPSAFNGKNFDCSIRDSALYNRCVSLAKNPSVNIARAKVISNSGANVSPWRNTVNHCGL